MGGKTISEVFLGMEKSSISLFRIIPVVGERNLEPKYELMVVVMETALRSMSTMEMCEVPWSGIGFHL